MLIVACVWCLQADLSEKGVASSVFRVSVRPKSYSCFIHHQGSFGSCLFVSAPLVSIMADRRSHP